MEFVLSDAVAFSSDAVVVTEQKVVARDTNEIGTRAHLAHIQLSRQRPQLILFVYAYLLPSFTLL